MCFLIQPIVMVHTANNSTGKPLEKEGKAFAEFDVFFQQSVETEKVNEVNVESPGFLTQLFSIVPMAQPSITTNAPLKLTENIDNIQMLENEISPSVGELIKFQQDQLPNFFEAETILLQKDDSNEVNPLKSKEATLQADVSQDEAFIDKLIKKLTNPVQSVLEEGNVSNLNEQQTNLITSGNPSIADAQSLENPFLNSFQNQSQNPIDSIAKTVTNTPISANQFDQEIVNFVESTIQMQNLGDGLEATFSLKPEQLGKVDVKVSIVDGNVAAEFLTSTQAGKDLLESHVQTLRLALETQGFQVDKINISQQSAASLLGSFSQKGESNGRHTQQDSKKRHIQNVQNQETEYRDYDLDLGSQINTTA